MKIDLHGLTVEEATPIILSALISLDMDSFSHSLEIITGKGQGFIMMATLNLLDEENREYEILENKVIVYKKENNNDEDWTNIMNELIDDEDN